MLELENNKTLLLDLKANSTSLERLFFRISTDPKNTFETSAIHPSLKYQFQLEEKIMKYLGVELSTLHREEHIDILDQTKKLHKQWEAKLISDSEYADVVLTCFLSHKFEYDDAIINSIDE